MSNRNYTVQELINDPTFVEWATGKAEGERTEYWNTWIASSEDNRKTALEAQKKITGLRFTTPQLPDIEHEWDRVRADINKKEKSTFHRQKAITRPKSRFNQLYKLAAVLLIGAFIGLGMYLYQEVDVEQNRITVETVRTDFGEQKTIKLFDGSTIVLAAGSRLSYNSNWLGQPIKRVKLRGEAYFTITPQKAKAHPKFIVETKDGTASVWGTRFNVITKDAITEVVLEEGEVRVQAANENQKPKSEKIMKPGEIATFSKEKPGIKVNKVNTAVYTSWTTNELYFDNTPFALLVNRIERTYGVNVKVKETALLDIKMSGSIDFRSLEGLIKAVSEVIEVNIYKSGHDIIIQQKSKNQPGR